MLWILGLRDPFGATIHCESAGIIGWDVREKGVFRSHERVHISCARRGFLSMPSDSAPLERQTFRTALRPVGCKEPFTRTAHCGVKRAGPFGRRCYVGKKSYCRRNSMV